MIYKNNLEISMHKILKRIEIGAIIFLVASVLCLIWVIL